MLIEFQYAIVLAIVLLLQFLSIGDLAAQNAKRAKAITKATIRSKGPDANGRETIIIDLVISDGCTLYAHKVGLDLFEPAAFRIDIVGSKKPAEVEFHFPKGELRTLGGGLKYWAYRNRVTFTGSLRRAKGDDGPLNAVLRFNGSWDRGY